MARGYKYFEAIEKHAGKLGIFTAIMVSLGGLAEITPLFVEAHSITASDGTKPYDALRLAGKDIYVREGCYTCHTQMIRSLRAETQRYGAYSIASESVYDRPHQWGSKRTGPDLARVGGKYSNEWHQAHFRDPRSVVPESVMPTYGFLARRDLVVKDVAGHLRALRAVGVPYTDDMIKNAAADLEAQADPQADTKGVTDRYPKAALGDFDGDPKRLTEMDALIAYMQILGRMVDFKTVKPEQLRQ